MSDLKPIDMERAWTMPEHVKQKLEESNRAFSKTLNEGKGIKQTMDKDSFLHVLVAQLKNQDPTNPMEDKQFISQMAQFNSLEQMMQLNSSFESMAASMDLGQALGYLGKTVVVSEGHDMTGKPQYSMGKVDSVAIGSPPKFSINDKVYEPDEILAIQEAPANETLLSE